MAQRLKGLPGMWETWVRSLGRKVTTNLESIFKSRDSTLLTKICIVKAMVFLVAMYGCESWTRSLSTKELILPSCGAGEDS